MDGFERRKEQNREKIITAAISLLSKYGISKVSIGDIARQAGVSQVTIYNLFGNKDGLVEACIGATMKKFISEFRAILKVDKPFVDKLEDILRFFVEMTESNQGLGNINVTNYPQYRELIESSITQIYDVLAEFIKEGQKRGFLNPDISDDAVRAFIEIFIRGINACPELHARSHRDPQFFHDLLQLMFVGFSRVDRMVKEKKALSAKQ